MVGWLTEMSLNLHGDYAKYRLKAQNVIGINRKNSILEMLKSEEHKNAVKP